MSVVSECLSEVSLGDAQSHLNLQLFPLLHEGAPEPGYKLLDEALERGFARVTEVSEEGSVPELKFINEGPDPVLLLDGEELIGAKQNRILNLSVLAPVHKETVIPVSCVEAGRWHRESEEFMSARRAHYAAGRARKAASVSESLRTHRSRRSDQAEVWADISAKSVRMAASSDTGAAAAMYETHESRLEEYLAAFTPVEEQVGALFALNGKVQGFDLFDATQTAGTMLPKLVQSYALDAIDAGLQQARPALTEDVSEFLEETSNARIERFEAVGEGEDLRLGDKGLTGGALVAGGHVVHMCVFRLTNGGGDVRSRRQSRLARPSVRQRRSVD